MYYYKIVLYTPYGGADSERIVASNLYRNEFEQEYADILYDLAIENGKSYDYLVPGWDTEVDPNDLEDYYEGCGYTISLLSAKEIEDIVEDGFIEHWDQGVYLPCSTCLYLTSILLFTNYTNYVIIMIVKGGHLMTKEKFIECQTKNYLDDAERIMQTVS